MADTKKIIRILFIISTLKRMGGAEKNLYDVVENIDPRNFISTVVAFQGGEMSNKLKSKGYDVYEYGITRLLSPLALKKAWELRRIIIENKIDIVVTYHHDADIWGLFVSLLAGGMPLISSRRDMGYQLTSKHVWFYRIFGRRFSRLITVSDAVKNEIAKREWITPNRMVTIHNGLNPEQFKDHSRVDKIKEELGISTQDVIIGMVASFRPIKGQIYLVEAIKEVVAEFRNTRVVIAGYNDTEYFRQVNDRIRELALDDHFVFTGARSDIPDLLSIFDIFVISSVNEGFSNAIIEAMAAGKPVVAANSGGNPESVHNEINGMLFAPCDSHALAQCLLALIRDPDMRNAMSKKGMCAIEKNFRLDHMIQKIEKLVKETIST